MIEPQPEVKLIEKQTREGWRSSTGKEALGMAEKQGGDQWRWLFSIFILHFSSENIPV